MSPSYDRTPQKRYWTPGKVIAALGVLVGVIVLITTISGIWTTVDAGEIVVKQGIMGDLVVWADQGPKWQMWGKITRYKRSTPYYFSSKKDQGNSADESIKMRFNDGGHGNFSGSLRYDLPTDETNLIKIHKTFGSQQTLEQSMIRTNIEKVVYLSGSIVSSTQSYAERRADLLAYIEDQAKHGLYKSSSKCEKQPDPVTKQDRTVCVVEIEKDTKTGEPARLEKSPLEDYGIKLSAFSVNDIQYDADVTKQIKMQQDAIAAVQVSLSQAKQAEQNAITAAENGKAAAAKAKWDQEALKAKAVTEAEQIRDVAKLAKETAELTKAKLIAEGEGESTKRKLIMAADGALNQKIDRDIQVAKIWAEAYAKQRPTPDVVFGTSGNGGSDLGSLMMMSAAKQAGLLGK
ncbi:Band 7 domain containing protein [uncultured Caudovirales phage]|uniref:Band 7 domain containing protein n=1 Tax=uncultured Caudovirales phage TaxID=2100421 RepID=A0A6J5LC00_9CAUD|nr:Band 7 domain containing protein [uncultured Caudovirales phage]CAB4134945.1 Band 7 domain containing protein [uncultured Caudovirales phage]